MVAEKVEPSGQQTAGKKGLGGRTATLQGRLKNGGINRTDSGHKKFVFDVWGAARQSRRNSFPENISHLFFTDCGEIAKWCDGRVPKLRSLDAFCFSFGRQRNSLLRKQRFPQSIFLKTGGDSTCDGFWLAQPFFFSCWRGADGVALMRK